MLSVKFICFTASYTVAFVLEVSRLLFRSGVRGAIMMGFAGVGLFAHTMFLANRAAAAKRSPLSSWQDWYLLAAWVLVVVYLYLTYYHPRTAFGVFLLPFALGLIAEARFASNARFPASKAWGIVHGTSLLLAVVSVSVGFVAGLMYLEQARRLKHKLPPLRGLRLPSLEWLQRTNSRAIVISALMLSVGVASGVVLNLTNRSAENSVQQEAAGLSWIDPAVLATVAWLLIAIGISALYRPSRQGHKVVCFTVVSFVFLVIALGVSLPVVTQHGP